LNHTTDLRYFQYIVPCGLTKPVTSMQELGSEPSREEAIAALSNHFKQKFQPSRDHEEAGVLYTETYK
jgi:lipoyl(octanoyl) transferase